MRKRILAGWLLGALAVPVVAVGSAYAGCAEDVPAQAARLATNGEGSLTEDAMASMKSAFDLLTQAQAKCQQGDEIGSAEILEQFKTLLASMGR